MMRLRRASAIATLSLLAWTTTASAECAWVLWLSRVSTVSGIETHDIYSAHATRRECDGELPDQATLLRKNGYNVAGGSSGSHELLATKTNEKWRFYCLPDTVDPRGPKGK